MKIVVKDEQKLRELVVKKGFSPRKFGMTILGLSSGYTSQIFTGKRNPSPEIAKKIVDALEVEFDDIFFIQSACKSGQKSA